jgi:endonuclease G, mitochondrial
MQAGQERRPKGFTMDPNLSPECQQFSTSSYAGVHAAYNRGHLVRSGHMNYNRNFIRRAHYMTNVVPQTVELNGGLWLDVENTGDCNREAGIQIFGGNIYNDTSNDFFLKSHGVRTPEYMWKVMYAGEEVIAYMFPNNNGLSNRLKDYIVSVKEIEDAVNDGLGPIPVPERLKSTKARNNWQCGHFMV